MVNENRTRSLGFDSSFPREPYFSLWPSCIKQMFDPSNKSKIILTVLLHHIQSRCTQKVSAKEVTYNEVMTLIDNVSIFAGKSPFASFFYSVDCTIMFTIKLFCLNAYRL